MNDIVDMSQFVEAKSDQLNADDLIGAPRTITVTRVTGNDGDQPISIHYQSDNGKPFKPCKTIRRVLLAVWGRNAADYVGRSMTLYRDDGVTFGGLNVGGIRISHMSHIDKKTVVVVMKTKGKKAGIEVSPLVITASQDTTDWPKFTATTLAAISRAPDIDKLNTFIDSRHAKLGTLATEAPDAWQAIDDALRVRRAELLPEGRPDDAFGDQHDDA
ncbi:hypothetical protein UFOVP5_32 [uncultured Caudovirales phage]|uniref:Uncharacterized protein n=1 Tax=uncultured Caudovirales phage TaxID=2100421 RepID=A0A6J5KH04_9CAUD|nr:hypothetical protein UFOVP5_32 [uncultured Caudovirales phage]